MKQKRERKQKIESRECKIGMGRGDPLPVKRSTRQLNLNPDDSVKEFSLKILFF